MKHWIKRASVVADWVADIAAEGDFSLPVAEIVAQRAGREDWRAWLRPNEVSLCDPFELPGMATAVGRIVKALQGGEPISVFGDYDADGITGTTLLVRALTAAGGHVRPFFPDRESEGYGLTERSVARWLERHKSPAPRLLITVDCGISCVAEIAAIRARGIDVVVTDHHTLPPTLPKAEAVVNPQMLPADHPAHGICGCATAFTLVRALAQAGLPLPTDELMDLAAIATIADVMQLTGDNRAIVAQGLAKLSAGRGNPGLQALLKEVRGRGKTAPLTAEEVAFGLVPCINAAGRVGSALLAHFAQTAATPPLAGRLSPLHRVYGMLAQTGDERLAFAKDLVTLNRLRKTAEQELLRELEAKGLTLSPGGHVLILACSDVYAGVAGIVAARLMERVGAPVAIVCRGAEGGGHGSMRTCGQWHAVEALRTVEDLLITYGGHEKAAGFALKPGAYEAFCTRFPRAFAGDMQVEPQLYDADLSGLTIDYPRLCQELKRLEPCGHGNPKPIFRARVRLLSAKAIGKEGTHLSLQVQPEGSEAALKAVWFGAGKYAAAWLPGIQLELFFALDEDTFFSTPRPVLMVRDAAPIA